MNGEGPVDLGRATAAETWPQIEGELVGIQAPGGLQVAVAEVAVDVRVVVLTGRLLEALPAAQHQREIAPLDAALQHQPIPAARQGLATAVGLVVETDGEHLHLEAQAGIQVGAEHRHQLGLVVGLAEGRREALVVHLPVGLLGVAQPQVAMAADQPLPQLRLEADQSG